MPITQERFMNIIGSAKKIINSQQKVHNRLREALVVNISHINSVLARSQDESAKEALTMLLDTLRDIREAFAEVSDGDMMEMIAVILAEEIHFKRVGERNRRARYYQTEARRDKGILPKAQQVELATPMSLLRSIPLAPPPTNIENNPIYIAQNKQIRKQFWPGQVDADGNIIAQVQSASADADADAPKETNEQIIARERSDNATMFPNTALPIDEAAERELALMQAEAAKHNGMRPGYKDPAVLTTSTPPDEVLYAPPLPIGKDVL